MPNDVSSIVAPAEQTEVQSVAKVTAGATSSARLASNDGSLFMIVDFFVVDLCEPADVGRFFLEDAGTTIFTTANHKKPQRLDGQPDRAPEQDFAGQDLTSDVTQQSAQSADYSSLTFADGLLTDV